MPTCVLVGQQRDSASFSRSPIRPHMVSYLCVPLPFELGRMAPSTTYTHTCPLWSPPAEGCCSCVVWGRKAKAAILPRVTKTLRRTTTTSFDFKTRWRRFENGVVRGNPLLLLQGVLLHRGTLFLVANVVGRGSSLDLPSTSVLGENEKREQSRSSGKLSLCPQAAREACL